MITQKTLQEYESPEIQTVVLGETEVLCSSPSGTVDDFNVIPGIF